MDRLLEARRLLDEALAAETLSPYVDSRLRALQPLLDGIRTEAYETGWDDGYQEGKDQGWADASEAYY